MVKVLERPVKVDCYHCGNECEDTTYAIEDKAFCCSGCKTVYEILEENNLCAYYDFNENSGVSLKAKDFKGKYDYLASKEIENQLLDFRSEEVANVTFYIPAVHCSSCVWLLENFNKILQGVHYSRLNFIRKELALSYDPSVVSLKEIVELMATLGYAPLINLGSVDKPKRSHKHQHNLLLKIGVVGFCSGNIMLMSFPEYFNLDLQNAVDASYQKFFLYLNLLLGLPVFFYGASDYLKGAYVSLKENFKGNTKILSVDIPITLGISALFIRSVYETLVNQSAGYWDSLAGLVLFLLAGKYLQQLTYNFLSFERDYKSYFPLAVKVVGKDYKNITELKKDEIIEVRNNELIPCDALLLSNKTLIDYGFVTGESRPISAAKGEVLFAGGKLLGEKVELLVQKEASQSYLTQLWNNEAFKKERVSLSSDFANKFSKYFTYIALGIAFVTGLYWYFNDTSLIWNSVTAVLMVACPCALTLAMPFGMNAASAIFSKNKFFVKNQDVIPLMAEVDALVFDKTGTLTHSKTGTVNFTGNCSPTELAEIRAFASQSIHPLSKLVTEYLGAYHTPHTVLDFEEIEGLGIKGKVNGKHIRLGSKTFLDLENNTEQGQVFVEIDGVYRGSFMVQSEFRKGWKDVLKKLQTGFYTALVSGDSRKDEDKVKSYFKEGQVWFNQKPKDKLDYIKGLQNEGHKVLMIGDGLNDAGALKQSNVGVALSEDINAFSPACDAILDANNFNRLGDYILFSKTAMRVVVAGFVLSLLYNVIGIGLAASGFLSPLKAAIFMPFSSITTVLFTVGLTYFMGKIKRLI